MDLIDFGFNRGKNSHLEIKKELCLNITPEMKFFSDP